MYTYRLFYVEDVKIIMQKIKNTLTTMILLFSFNMAAHAAVISNHSNIEDDLARKKMILHYINIYRAKHFLAPLKLNETASQIATEHSRAMAQKIVPFGHARFNQRIKRLYQVLAPCNGGAENVAFYKIDAKKLVDAWIASPGHRHNILGGYNVTGIGIAHGKPGWAYFTQVFVKTDNKFA